MTPTLEGALLYLKTIYGARNWRGHQAERDAWLILDSLDLDDATFDNWISRQALEGK